MEPLAPHGHVCRDCKWFNGSECRRFPPTWVSWPSDNQHPVIYWPQTSYPLTGPDQWCGEWSKLLENPEPAQAGLTAGGGSGSANVSEGVTGGVQCDACGEMKPRDEIAKVTAYGIETSACAKCRGDE